MSTRNTHIRPAFEKLTTGIQDFLEDWHIIHTGNHLANTSTSYDYVDNIITPFVLDVKDKLDLPFAQKSLIILDVLVHNSGKISETTCRKILFMYMCQQQAWGNANL